MKTHIWPLRRTRGDMATVMTIETSSLFV